MGVAKVIIDDTTIVDMTDATASASELLTGYTAYGADGSKMTGTASGETLNYGILSSPSPIEMRIAYPLTKQLLYSWDLTQSLTDTINGAVITLGNNAIQDSNGLTIPDVSSYATMPFYYRPYYTYEFDIASMNKDFSSGHGRFITLGAGDSGFIARNGSSWGAYLNGAWDTNQGTYSSLANQTLTFVTQNNAPQIYLNGNLWYSTSRQQSFGSNNKITIGSSSGQSFYTVTISGIRVYWGNDYIGE